MSHLSSKFFYFYWMLHAGSGALSKFNVPLIHLLTFGTVYVCLYACYCICLPFLFMAFSALTLLVGCQEGHPARKI